MFVYVYMASIASLTNSFEQLQFCISLGKLAKNVCQRRTLSENLSLERIPKVQHYVHLVDLTHPESSVEKIVLDTAENKPFTVCQKFLPTEFVDP